MTKSRRLSVGAIAFVVALTLWCHDAQAQFGVCTTSTCNRYDVRGTNGNPTTVSAANWGAIAYNYATQQLVCSTNGSAWSPCFSAGGGGGGVSSFNARVGAVTFQTGDATAAQITSTAPGNGITATDVQGAINQLAARTSSGVTTFNLRTGAVTFQTGDADVSQVTGAAPIASPSFTGDPRAPAAPIDDNDTTIANTGWVQAEITNALPCATCASTNTAQTITAMKTLSVPVGPALTVARPTTGPGTVTVTNGNTTLTGSATDFQNYFRVGDILQLVDGQTRTIATITSATAATVTSPWVASCSLCTYVATQARSITLLNRGDISTVGPTVWSTDGIERMRLEGDGDLSLGSATPPTEATLYVQDMGSGQSSTVDVRANAANTSAVMEVQRNDYASTFKSMFMAYSGSGTAGDILTGVPYADSAAITFGDPTNSVIRTVGTGPLIFGMNGTERMRIDSSGNVGIGGIAPTKRLHVYNGAAVIGGTQQIIEGLTPGYGAGIEFGSKLSGSGAYKEMAKIVADGDAGWLSADVNSQRSRLTFWTTQNGTFAERMRISPDGNVGIGGTPASVSKLHVFGNVRIQNSAVSPTYLHIDSTSNAAGKLWRIGTTGAIGWNTFDLYNETDNRTVWSADSGGAVAIGGGAVGTRRLQVVASSAAGNFGESDAAIRIVNAVGSTGGEKAEVQFGSMTLDKVYAAISGYLNDSSNSTAGDLVFSTRNGSTAPTLTEHLRINQSGFLDIRDVNRTLANSQSNLNIRTTDPQAGAIGGSMAFGGVYTGTSQSLFGFIAGRKENSIDGNYAGYLSLATRAHGSGAPTERMMITSVGQVGVNTIPAADVHVKSGTGNHVMLEIDAPTDKYSQLGLYENGGLKWNIHNDYSTDRLTFNSGSAAARFQITQGGEILQAGRTVPIGEFSYDAYDATDYTQFGGGSFTVEAGDFEYLRWTIVGRKMTVQWSIVNATAGGAGFGLAIRLPAGYTASGSQGYGWNWSSDAGAAWVQGVCATSSNLIIIYKGGFGGFSVSANNTSTRGEITFETSTY